jgi:hypothetical protein
LAFPPEAPSSEELPEECDFQAGDLVSDDDLADFLPDEVLLPDEDFLGGDWSDELVSEANGGAFFGGGTFDLGDCTGGAP